MQQTFVRIVCFSPTAMNDDTAALERTRVESRQIPIFTRDLRSLAAEMGLDWLRARSLWTAGILSFDPDAVLSGDEAREVEFVFVGSLAAAGIPHEVLRLMLRGLRKPYVYDVSRIFFDWRSRCWRPLPVPDDPEAAFLALLDQLDPQREGKVLLEIRDMADNALDLARGRRHLFGHEGSTQSRDLDAGPHISPA